MKTILITGATSGIGEAAVNLFLSKGFKVIATGRNKERLDEIAKLGAETYKLDITNQQEINNLVTDITAAGKKIDVLLNNAGYGQFGTIEETSDEKARAQFDTNVFGLAAMCRAFIPLMRNNGGGRIINVSSVAGKTSMPGGGWYAASKFAVEALSDALRWETKQFGIKVSVILPGPIKTGFATTVNSNVVNDVNGPYGTLVNNLTQSTKSFKGGSVEGCARKIYRAATKRNPKNRYFVTKEAFIIRFLLATLPPKLMDYFVIKMFMPALKWNCREKK
jgi:short-subunit dehydrogenase